MMISSRVLPLLALVQLAACGQTRLLKAPPAFSEAVLGAYRKDVSGGFSPYWVAYIVEPEKGAADQSTFVELNGRRLGPYEQVSGMMEVSRNGKHIAFAAEKAKKWVVVVDGVEKYTHEGLLWPWSAWSPSLEGNSYIPQTRAAVLEFSPNGETIAYPAQSADGKCAVFVNGKPGPSYPSVGSGISFVAGRVKYFAFPEEKKIVEAHGAQLLGPYDTSYRTKISADGDHYAFWAKRGDKAVLVVDGQERDLPGELADYVIGNGGFLAYAYKISGKYRVRVGNADLPGEYDEVHEMVLSPDNKKVAFWALRGGTWMLSAGDKALPGFAGYFYYQAGGTTYSIMWSPDSQHVAYYVRDDRGLVLDGEKLDGKFTPPGLAIQNIVDDRGRTVGSGLMQGPHVDATAFVQAVLMRDKTKCDPFSVALFGKDLTCVEKREGVAYMHVGDKTEGPFRSIRSTVLKSAQDKNYAYVVETEKGQQFVIDGTPSPRIYEAIYRPVFNEDNGSIDYLAVKDGKLFHVVEPLRPK
ncbi:MAG: hypothetical protein ACLQOO_13140 [Terriglobia bacterium]